MCVCVLMSFLIHDQDDDDECRTEEHKHEFCCILAPWTTAVQYEWVLVSERVSWILFNALDVHAMLYILFVLMCCPLLISLPGTVSQSHDCSILLAYSLFTVWIHFFPELKSANLTGKRVAFIFIFLGPHGPGAHCIQRVIRQASSECVGEMCARPRPSNRANITFPLFSGPFFGNEPVRCVCVFGH